MKKNKIHWLILTGMPFEDSGGGQRAAQIARELGKMDYQITYIYAINSMEKNKVEVVKNIPNFKTAHINEFSLEKFIKKRYEKLIVLVEVPHPLFLPIIKRLKECSAIIVFERIDPWETNLGGKWYQKSIEEEIWRLADVLTATAVDLQKNMVMQTGLPVHLIPNAYNNDLFDCTRSYQRPKELPPSPIIGYIGALWGDWFDIELVCEVAKKFPYCNIALIGDYGNQFAGKTPRNIRFLGLKPQNHLPAYLSYFDVAIIPFRVNKLTLGVNPLKVYEYLAMKVPVVSTLLPEVNDIPSVLSSDNHKSFIKNIDLALKNNIKTEGVSDWLKDNTWRARVKQLEKLVYDNLISDSSWGASASVIILNHNNYIEIQKCLNELRHYKDFLREIIVVDNNSSDGSKEWLEKQNDIILVKNPKNGCASGRNLGVAAASGEYLIFLDSDQFVEDSSFVEIPLKILQNNPSVGAVGYYGGWIANPHAPVLTTECISKPMLERVMKGKLYQTGIAYLGTGGMVIPRRVWEKTSGFDETYDPTTFEDTDISFQIKSLGYQLALCPAIKIKHDSHSTTGQLTDYREYYHRNRKYFIAKWRKQHDLFYSYNRNLDRTLYPKSSIKYEKKT